MTGMRLLVAGDKSQAGKSTVSMGLLGALLEAGFLASDIAYIKPATQCVSSTLTARFCETRGIAYEHIGPVVFYRGFTRERLDALGDASDCSPTPLTGGAAPDGDDLVAACAEAVERISEGKRVTIIDGVGYPSVGSIVRCSSADIAVACGAAVLIVGKSGVGDAVDSFNLCARYFEAQHVPVIGAIFNKVAPTGFYGLPAVGAYLRRYMAHARPRQRIYGLLPAAEALGALGADEACALAFKRPEATPRAGQLSPEDEKVVALVAAMFKEQIDVEALLADLEAALALPADWVQMLPKFAGATTVDG